MGLTTAGITRRIAAAGAVLALIGVGAAPVGAVPVPLPTPPPRLLPDPHITPPVVPVPLPVVVPAAGAGVVPGGASPLTGIGGDSSQPPPAGSPGQSPNAAYPGPSADEQAALPPESGRTDLEEQQWNQAQEVAALDAEFADSALLAHGSEDRFVWPIVFRDRAPLTQRFGCSELLGEPYNASCASKRWHPAIDLAIATGLPIFAAEGGVAHVYSSERGYGKHVLISHGDGWYTMYAHLSEFAVADRQVVAKGEMIGLAGSTGYSTGSHLHFEIRHETEYLDPCAFLKGC